MALPAPTVDLVLTKVAVFLDFDGTISTRDIGVHLLERFAAPEWRDLHERFELGEIDSRECLIDQWELITPDEVAMRAAAREVPIDAGFEPLVHALRAGGAEVAIVSDGFGFYVDEVAAPLDILVFTNTIDWSAGKIDFPHTDRCCPCTSCGVCKQAPIKDASYRGRTTVLVGDGASDRKAALLADVVFAKDALAVFCARAEIAFHPFDTLADVHAALLG